MSETNIKVTISPERNIVVKLDFGGYNDHGKLPGLSDDDHPQYVKHSLATAVNDFLVASGVGVFIKKTLTEVKTILGLGSAAYTASSEYLKVDQTTPQTVINGSPTFREGIVLDNNLGESGNIYASDEGKAIRITENSGLDNGLEVYMPLYVEDNARVTGTLQVTGAVSGSNLSGTNTGNETATSVGALINGADAKATPVDTDMVGLMDSAASNILKKLSWSNIKATLKTYFDSLYPLKANNLSDVANAATAFGNIKQAASTTATGVVELATDDETASIDTERVLTPSNLKFRHDSECENAEEQIQYPIPTSVYMLKAAADGSPATATNTDTDVADAVTKKHTQNSDTGTSATSFKINTGGNEADIQTTGLTADRDYTLPDIDTMLAGSTLTAQNSMEIIEYTAA